jgi:hypothetical protein
VKFYKGWHPMQPEEFRQQSPPPIKNPQKAKNMKKRGEEPMREALFRMSGVDLTGTWRRTGAEVTDFANCQTRHALDIL